MKKYLILAATAALVLGACAKVETIAPKAEPQVIGFSNYAPKALNKAAAANYVEANALVADADFDVWAWKTPYNTSFTGSNGSAFFSSWYTVTYKNGGDTSGDANAYPDGYRYWPSGDTPDWLSFAAYYPSNGAGITAPAAGLGAYTFEAQATAAAQVDFMVSDVVKDQTYDNTNTTTKGTVNLTFRHQLTKVQVKFKTTQQVVDDEKTEVKITDAKFKSIKNTGTLTTAFDGSATTSTWSGQDGAVAYPIKFPTDALTATASTVANEDIFLMVPQTMLEKANAAAQYIEISWDVITDGVTTSNTKKLYLDDCKDADNGDTLANIDWNKNNFVTYVITVGPQPILFTATAEEWDHEQIGYYNVQ